MFNSSEQAFMYCKAKLFGDEESAKLILKSPDPAKQKAIGKHIQGFNDETWDEHKYKNMLDAVTAKFEQNRDLSEKLKKTGNKTLVECNPGDYYWGIGLDLQHQDIWQPAKWIGENKLGEILQIIRDRL